PMAVVCETCFSGPRQPCTYITGPRTGEDRSIHRPRSRDAQRQFNRLNGPMPQRHEIPEDDDWIYHPLRSGDLAGLILGIRLSVARALATHHEELGALHEVAIGQEGPEMFDHVTNPAILVALTAVTDRSRSGIDNLASRLAARGFLERFPDGSALTNLQAARVFSPGELPAEGLTRWKAAINAVSAQQRP
ncbi:hypothetical protein, partial [Streptomyces katrae]|uniref:hypothetical protein n=1 Tax=Streptomyces katrae TaxID=68223 RepID=UPI000B18F2D3